MVAPDRDKLRRAFRVPTPRAAGAAPDVAADRGSANDAPSPRAEPAAPSPASAPVARPGTMREFLLRRQQQFAEPPRSVVALPPADELTTPHGVLWRRELRYPLAQCHGDVPFARVGTLDGGKLAALGKHAAFATLRAEQCLFLDTETTGLSGGAGTIVFAYGLGFVRGAELVVEQLFLRDFGEEPAMLHHVAARLAEFPVPVTFVGKSYDRHRIAARLAVHKVKAPVLTDVHLDLFHLVRRQFAKQWPDTRLRTAEQRLLGLHRHDDLPGSEAPAAFLQWVRDRTGPVDRVLEHNRLDVLSLVALLGVLGGAPA
ncbi:MAG: ribonuclease H-like domain-containing protein [Planctomycetota bacterium]|jgi:uncharacterized protein YprB with RNaseH-like and TPR domain